MKQCNTLAIHDLSCVGRCSLTVALPILSAAGIETSVLPTAVLSAHSGFEGFTYRDMTGDIPGIVKHLTALNLRFDALYSGYLGSYAQLGQMAQLFEQFGSPETLILTDPVMADDGKLYCNFTPEFARGMAELCARADVIVPNVTEAFFLLGIPYEAPPYSEERIRELLLSLAKLGSFDIVLTGVVCREGEQGIAVYERAAKRIATYCLPAVEGTYCGTGDVFASALLAGLLNGISLYRSAAIAADFTTASIRSTRKEGRDVRYGVNFERQLPSLLKALHLV